MKPVFSLSTINHLTFIVQTSFVLFIEKKESVQLSIKVLISQTFLQNRPLRHKRGFYFKTETFQSESELADLFCVFSHFAKSFMFFLFAEVIVSLMIWHEKYLLSSIYFLQRFVFCLNIIDLSNYVI